MKGVVAFAVACLFGQCFAGEERRLFQYGDANEVQIAAESGDQEAVITSTVKPAVDDKLTFIDGAMKQQVTITKVIWVKKVGSTGGRRMATIYESRVGFKPALKYTFPAGSSIVVTAPKWCDSIDSYADYAALHKNQKKAWEACKLGCTGADYVILGKNVDWKKAAAVCKGKSLEQKFEDRKMFDFQGPQTLPVMAGLGFFLGLSAVTAAVTALRRRRTFDTSTAQLLNESETELPLAE